MKITKILVLLATSLVFITACENSERQKAGGEKFQGNVQETVGKLTNDSSEENEGKWNKTKGDLRSTKEDIKDVVSGD